MFSDLVGVGSVLLDGTRERYRIEQRLHRGGYGATYQAVDLVSSELVAIKVLHLHVALDAGAMADLAREASAAQAVAHRNVARTLALVPAENSGIGAPYLVLEFIRGGDLLALLETRGTTLPDQAELLDWMAQLCCGLRAIHDHLLHRDLKPGNVLVDGGVLKICDFGMAKHIDEATRTRTFKGLGTYPYQAPETWQGKSATPETDIYSLGVTFYQMATNQLPFTARDEHEWRQAHLYTSAPRLQRVRPELDERLDALLARMLAKHPKDRFATAAQIGDVLEEIAQAPLPSVSDTGIDRVVTGARQAWDRVIAAQTQAAAKDDARMDAARATASQVAELADRLDALVHQVNRRVLGRRIEIQGSPGGKLYDGVPYRTYEYLEKTLSLEFLSLSPDDVLVEDWESAAVAAQLGRRKAAQRELTIDGQNVVAIGTLKLSRFVRESFGVVTFPRPVNEAPDHGLHLLLLRSTEATYGDWKTCELAQHPFTAVPARKQVVVSKAREVVEAIAQRMIAGSFVVQLRDFADSDFVSLLGELVRS